MPVWTNITNSELYVPREDGLKADIVLKPGEGVNGSTFFYEKMTLAPDKLLARSVDGWEFPVTLDVVDPYATIYVDGFIAKDKLIATAADKAENALLTEGSPYTAFGKISWVEGAVAYEQYFEITGDNHIHFSVNNGLIFEFDAAAVDFGKGIIIFTYIGAGAAQMTADNNVVISVVYECSQQGYRGNTFTNVLLDQPYFTTIQEVINTMQVTSQRIFYTGSKIGDPAVEKIMTYKTNTDTQPQVTVERLSSVTSDDLNAVIF